MARENTMGARTTRLEVRMDRMADFRLIIGDHERPITTLEDTRH